MQEEQQEEDSLWYYIRMSAVRLANCNVCDADFFRAILTRHIKTNCRFRSGPLKPAPATCFLYILSIREGLNKSVLFSEHCQISSTLPPLCLDLNKQIWRFLGFYDHTTPTPTCNLKILFFRVCEKLIDLEEGHYSLSQVTTFHT